MLRTILTLILVCSLTLSAWNIFQIQRNPVVAAFKERAGDELTSALNREMARRATPKRIEARLTELLEQDPTPWIAIDAVRDVAKSAQIALSPELITQIDTRYDVEHGLLQSSGKCISCGWDAANCELSAILLCRAPVDLTPVGDIAGVIRESGNYVLGNEVDKIDLMLSAVGLGAVAIAPATGGSSLAVKVGASAIKTTKKLGNLSPGLTRILTRSADEAIDWQKLSKASPIDFPDALKDATDLEALRPITETLAFAGDIRANTSAIEALHLIKYVESAEDAAKTARVSKALGPRTVGAFEVIGKSRIVRATLKYSSEAWGVIAGTISTLISLALLAGNLIGNAVLRRLRKMA